MSAKKQLSFTPSASKPDRPLSPPPVISNTSDSARAKRAKLDSVLLRTLIRQEAKDLDKGLVDKLWRQEAKANASADQRERERNQMLNEKKRQREKDLLSSNEAYEIAVDKELATGRARAQGSDGTSRWFRRGPQITR